MSHAFLYMKSIKLPVKEKHVTIGLILKMTKTVSYWQRRLVQKLFKKLAKFMI